MEREEMMKNSLAKCDVLEVSFRSAEKERWRLVAAVMAGVGG